MMKVAVVGATGNTGSSIINSLLDDKSGSFSVTALIRPGSEDRPDVRGLRERGVKTQVLDLKAPKEEAAKSLEEQDVVVAAISIPATGEQIPLATAAKLAGVKRFMPCFFAPVAPPKGAVTLRDTKEDVLNHVKSLALPYTIIDIGWWFQLTLPTSFYDVGYGELPGTIPGDGKVLSAFTDARDVGNFVVKTIVDPRTINQSVFCYSEMMTMTQVYDVLDKVSGRQFDRNYISDDEMTAKLAELAGPEHDGTIPKAIYQYWKSWGIRGENSEEYAKYLGYLSGKELYPELKVKSFEEYINEHMGGK